LYRSAFCCALSEVLFLLCRSMFVCSICKFVHDFYMILGGSLVINLILFSLVIIIIAYKQILIKYKQIGNLFIYYQNACKAP
jgi:hypothetical protein